MFRPARATRTAWRLVGLTLLAGFALWGFGWVAYFIGSFVRDVWVFLLAVWIVQAGLTFWLCRDPGRPAPGDPRAVVSPADGLVRGIEELAAAPVTTGAPCRRVILAVGWNDVHTFKAPLAGRVAGIWHEPGVDSPPAAGESFRLEIEPVAHPACRIGVRIFAGGVPGWWDVRPRLWSAVGTLLGPAERFGLLPAAGRVEVLLPLSLRLQVAAGQRVIGGSTVLAMLD